MIQFAENFKNDNSESIIYRCTRSNRDTTNITDNPKSWPIRGSSTSTLETNIKPFDTSNVTGMLQMFYDCSSLTSDLSKWRVPLISTRTTNFDIGVPTDKGYKPPVWGTCPTPPSS